MAIRTNQNEVCSLLNLSDEDNVFPAIIAANALVEQLLLSKGLSDTLLKQIELMLSGHFYQLGTPEIASEAYTDARFTYVVTRNESGLRQTKWGQMAITLDISGTLTDLGKVRASITSL